MNPSQLDQDQPEQPIETPIQIRLHKPRVVRLLIKWILKIDRGKRLKKSKRISIRKCRLLRSDREDSDLKRKALKIQKLRVRLQRHLKTTRVRSQLKKGSRSRQLEIKRIKRMKSKW
jgi:hypothetical protein